MSTRVFLSVVVCVSGYVRVIVFVCVTKIYLKLILKYFCAVFFFFNVCKSILEIFSSRLGFPGVLQALQLVEHGQVLFAGQVLGPRLRSKIELLHHPRHFIRPKHVGRNVVLHHLPPPAETLVDKRVELLGGHHRVSTDSNIFIFGER